MKLKQNFNKNKERKQESASDIYKLMKEQVQAIQKKERTIKVENFYGKNPSFEINNSKNFLLNNRYNTSSNFSNMDGKSYN